MKAKSLAAAAAALALCAPAQAEAAKSRFLKWQQWPTDATYVDWQVTSSGAGYASPIVGCANEVLPKAKTRYQYYKGARYSYGLQHISSFPSAKAAARMTGRYLAYMKTCNAAKAAKAGHPQQVEVHGTYKKVDGGSLTVIGVYSTNPNPESIDWPHYIYLYGVGHKGPAFTAVELHREGTPAQAPVKAFTATSKAAIKLLAG